MSRILDFERPIAELESKINELKYLAHTDDLNIVEEISRLQQKLQKILKETYTKLTPWQKVQIARHPDRPKFSDYLQGIVDDFTELAGDRLFGEDCAIMGGLGKIDQHRVVIIGQEKGHDTETRLKHNFGMPKPEGYRKARRLMELADRFRLPVITFVDTAGAYPGIEAEERGQAEAIARCIETCLSINVPLISVVIGEGGSGGAIAIATANSILMLEHSVYSVISPEGCASILWKSATKAQEAAEAQRLTAQDLMRLGVIDGIIPEPLGGAHRQPIPIVQDVKKQILDQLKRTEAFSTKGFTEHRRNKFLAMGKKGL